MTIDGVAEAWRLEWRRPPIPNCMGEEWYTCPCNGEEFGEKGDLDLVRQRPGEPEDRLGLNALFDDRDAVLPRWAPTERERKTLKVPSQADLQTRPLVSLLKFGDYDHDGRATEFLLQVESTPCGHQASVVVGVDRKNPKLHVFSSVEALKDFLTLRPSEWEKVKTKLPQDFVETSCGDHGSDEEDSVTISIDAAGLHAEPHQKACP